MEHHASYIPTLAYMRLFHIE